MANLPYVIPYDSGFLEDGFHVPSPKTSSNPTGLALKADLFGGGEAVDYIHFSLVMHASRRQALYTACNVDAGLQKQAKRVSWSIDERLSEYQIGNEVYRDSPWDRGHLVRRQDVCWGDTRQRAQDASDSTFFYTNSSLQHENFNGDEWNQLEDWVLDRVTDIAPRLCVFTGQFLCPNDPRHTVHPGVSVQVPTAFWKLIVLRDPTDGGNDLTAAAFVMPQSEEFLRTITGQGAPVWPKEKLKTFQVEIADLERLSSLDFGDLRNVDDFPWNSVRFHSDAMWEAWRPILDPKDIIIGGSKRRRIGGGRALRVLSSVENSTRSKEIALAGSNMVHQCGDVLNSAHRQNGVVHSCGCAKSEYQSNRIATLERKLEVLAESIQAYAQQKYDDARELSEILDVESNSKVVRDSVDSANPRPGRIRTSGESHDSSQSIAIQLEQAKRDLGRAARLIENSTRIVGGERSKPGEFPSCVLVGDESRYYCTGVLISERLVLTAAHCGRDANRILAGLVDQGLESLKSAVKRNVIKAVRHSEYSQTRLPWNDLMLLILDEEISSSSLVQPAVIVDRNELKDISKVAIVGFGNNDAKSTQGFGKQRKAMVDVTETFDTSLITSPHLQEIQRSKGFSAPKEFFAGEKKSGIDTCEGDSGGPVYLETQSGWKLLGITSRPTNDSYVVCGDGGLYTSVPFYTEWIREVRNQFNI